MKKLILMFFILPFFIKAQNIYTIAGLGINGYTGDGWPAISAWVGEVTGIGTDSFGNVYFCDYSYGHIRKINVLGIITTIGGGGTSLSDSIPATSASISWPTGIYVSPTGDVYFTEGKYNRIRKISATGMITTIAGVPVFGGGFSGDGGPATAAVLHGPSDVILDMLGNVYFSDNVNERIRKVDLSGTISTIAGTGVSGFSGHTGPAISTQLYSPCGINIDGSGNVYFSDYNNNLIRKIDTNGMISTIGGINGYQGYVGDGGLATSAEIGRPNGLTFDASGNLYFADQVNGVIRKINTSGIISTIAGFGVQGYSGDNGLATLAKIACRDVTINSYGNLYIADGSNYRVREVCMSNCITNLDEANKTQLLPIYPNPTNNILHISDENNVFENSTIEVSNYLGQIIFKRAYSNEVDVSNLPTGIYTLRINASDKESLYSKFIKE